MKQYTPHTCKMLTFQQMMRVQVHFKADFRRKNPLPATGFELTTFHLHLLALAFPNIALVTRWSVVCVPTTRDVTDCCESQN